MRRIGLITLLLSLPGIANGLSAQETQDRPDSVEQDANIRSRNYMIKNGLPIDKWNYYYNPIDKLEGVDRDSPELMEPLPVNRKPFVSSYIFPILFPVLGDIITGAILSGADNARKY